jgi:hypothetical protein
LPLLRFGDGRSDIYMVKRLLHCMHWLQAFFILRHEKLLRLH